MTDWVTTERYALKAVLLAAATAAGARVEAEQNDPVSTSPAQAGAELPKLCVYAKAHDHSGNGNTTTWRTTATLVIDCWTYGTAAGGLTAREVAADSRDLLVAQVLAATTGAPGWISQWERITRVGVALGGMAQGQLVIGAAQVTITVELSTDHGIEDRSDTDPFEEAGATVENAIDPEGDPLQIEVELEQT